MDTRFILLPLLFSAQIAAAAPHADWPTETILPKATGASAGGGVQNNLVVTSTGAIIATYSEWSPSTGNAIYQTASIDDGSTWSAPAAVAPLSTMPIGMGHPSTALGPDGNLHLVWAGTDESSTPLVRRLYYAMQTTSTGLWSAQAVVASNPRGGMFGYYHVTVDQKNRVHVVWHEGYEDGPMDSNGNGFLEPSENNQAEVFYTRRESGQPFEPDQALSPSADWYPAAFPAGDLGAVSGDTIAFTWREQVGANDWDVHLRVSHDGGSTWEPIITATGGAGKQWDPYLLIDKNSTFHLGYHTNDRHADMTPDYRMFIGHSKDHGATWRNQGGASGFVQISQPGHNSEFAKMAYDKARNVVWLMWKRVYGPSLNDAAVTYICQGGEHIQTAYEEVTGIAGSFGMAFPDIAVGPDGRPCVTYQHDGDKTPTEGPVSLHFRKRTSIPAYTTFTGPWIYGGNVGWFNFAWGSGAECAAPQITDYFASGYVYAGNLGWLHLGDGAPTDGIQYSQTGGDYGVNLDPASGALSGHAYGANFGWVKFDWASASAMGSKAPQLNLTTGKFTGYAYGSNIGWIKLDAVSTAYLAVNAIAPGEDSDGDGIPDAHERRALWLADLPISLGTLGATGDLDGDGVSDLDEYLAGTRADAAGDAFRTTHTEHTPAGIVLDWKVAPGRVYDIQGSSTMAPNSWVNLATGLKPPAGADEHGVVIGLPENTERQFYRVVVRQPLHP